MAENYTSFQCGTQIANLSYTLPTAAPVSNGQFLTSDTSGVMSWATNSGGVTTLLASGSVTGSAITLTSIGTGYAYLAIEFTGIETPIGSQDFLIMRVSTNNGSSYASINYFSIFFNSAVKAATDTMINLALVNSTTMNASIILESYQGGMFPIATACSVYSSTTVFAGYGIYTGSSSAINAIQFKLNSNNNFSGSGTYAIYGVG